MKRLISALLILSTLLTILVSCGGENPETATTMTAQGNTPTDTTATTPAVTEPDVPENLRDDLGEYDFKNAPVTFLVRTAKVKEMRSEEQTGDLVSDAVYSRNLAVEERLGVDINVVDIAGEWSDRTNFINTVTKTVNAGDHDFDVVMSHNSYLINIGMENCAYDLNELEMVNLSKKWWNEAFTRHAVVNGKAFFAIGDITYSLYHDLSVCFFNKTITENNGITGLYDLVEAGGWTFDKLQTYAVQVGTDLDGNGIYDTQDLYGASWGNFAARDSAIGWNVPLTHIGEDGRHVLDLPNEKYVDAYNKNYNFTHNFTQVWMEKGGEKKGLTMFTQDQIMFYLGDLGYAEVMRDMESEYGIIPYPKYDDDQEEYVTPVRSGTTALLITSNTKNPDMAGATIEALCMEGYRQVTPAYYETALKLKYLSDERAMNLLDGIRDRAEYSFALVYSNYLSLITADVGDKIQNNVKEITSSIKASVKIWEKAIKGIYDTYDKMD